MKRYALIALLTAGMVSLTPAQGQQPILAAITGEGVCTAVSEDQPVQQARVKLLQAGAGFRILEVETEKFKARGPAVQVEEKTTGHVLYFLDYGSLGSISIDFTLTPAGKPKARLIIVKQTRTGELAEAAATLGEVATTEAAEAEERAATIRYEFNCIRK